MALHTCKLRLHRHSPFPGTGVLRQAHLIEIRVSVCYQNAESFDQKYLLNMTQHFQWGIGHRNNFLSSVTTFHVSRFSLRRDTPPKILNSSNDTTTTSHSSRSSTPRNRRAHTKAPTQTSSMTSSEVRGVSSSKITECGGKACFY